MDDYQNEAMPVGAAEVAAATQTLQRYKAGKAALDRRLVDNELWFRMGHWKNYQNPMMPGKAQPSSGWLFNSIANKHADAMDNYPEPNVLPRAADDEATARALSSVLPVVLEQADYEQVYSDCWWRKLKQGTGVTGVFWDPAARGGVGGYCGAGHELADALLGAGCGGHPGFTGFLQPEPGGHRTAHGPLPTAGRPHRRGAGCAPLHPRGRRGHRFPQCGGGLVL